MFYDGCVRSDKFQLFFPLRGKLLLRIVDQNGVFQIQTPGARIQIVAGE
ncbi:hypothetical protein NGUA15_00702 [Salmonella enterica]|nr:hypothetical protein NGUA15_00702 [Salmonella enterica]